jgi:hypothetical protein
MRYRDEIKRTYYSPCDKRVKAGTVKVIKYSDGRTFKELQVHNQKGWKQLEISAYYLLSPATKRLKG